MALCACGCGSETKHRFGKPNKFLRGHSNRLESSKVKYDHKELFLAKVNKSDGCWLWTGARNKNGYGVVRVKQKTYPAHRFMWQSLYGDVHKDLQVCHKCDNPPCVRPDHLFVGTRSDNMLDCVSKGRHFWKKKTACRSGHEFNSENTRLYRGRRYCIPCIKKYNAERYKNRVNVIRESTKKRGKRK